jgi:hypothetical protein
MAQNAADETTARKIPSRFTSIIGVLFSRNSPIYFSRLTFWSSASVSRL